MFWKLAIGAVCWVVVYLTISLLFIIFLPYWLAVFIGFSSGTSAFALCVLSGSPKVSSILNSFALRIGLAKASRDMQIVILVSALSLLVIFIFLSSFANSKKILEASGGPLRIMAAEATAVVVNTISQEDSSVEGINSSLTLTPTLANTPSPNLSIPTETTSPAPPTATPTSISPTATPKPLTATPTVGLTLAEESYRNKIAEQSQTMAKSFEKFVRLTESPRLWDMNWKIDLAVELATWRSIYTQAKAMTPSERFRPFHIKYMAALTQIESSATDLANGLDSGNSGLIDRATGKLKEGTRLLSEATELLKQIK